MNKIRIIILLLSCEAIMAQAQIMTVTSIEPLNMSQNKGQVMQAVGISPQGDYLLLSTDTRQGLVKWDLNSGSATTLTTDMGAGSDVRISADGSQIVYSEVSYKGRRRHQAVKAVDQQSGKKQTLVKATRHLQGFALDDGTAVTVTDDGTIKTHSLKKGASSSMSRPVLTKRHLKLYITVNGVTTLLAPNGDGERYIWGSLSPDGNRVLYYVSGRGAYVCDLDGSHVTSMGNLTAPKWWDNSTIVGMSEVDDEYSIVASSIVARTLDGRQQVLTGADVIATYPQPCSTAGKLAFSTPDGRIYLLTVE